MYRLLLILAATILYPASYGICDYFHYYHLNEWYLLRCYLYSVVIMLVGSVHFFKIDDRYEKYVTLFMWVLMVGMISTNLIDRAAAEYDFHWWDIFFVFVALWGGTKKIFRVFYEKTKFWKRK